MDPFGLCPESFARRETTKAERATGSYRCACGRAFRLGAAQRAAVDNYSCGVRVPQHKKAKNCSV